MADRHVTEPGAEVVEGRVYDPTLDSGRKAIITDDGEYVYIEDLLEDGATVRVTVEKQS